eukprot:scaffold77691_cov30-Tisochrysis_lutea.AAC.5
MGRLLPHTRTPVTCSRPAPHLSARQRVGVGRPSLSIRHLPLAQPAHDDHRRVVARNWRPARRVKVHCDPAPIFLSTLYRTAALATLSSPAASRCVSSVRALHIMGGGPSDPPPCDAGVLTHVDDSGRASMVDVGHKRLTRREAVAQATVDLGPVAYGALTSNAKGDVLAVARVAGIGAAKRTSELIPLCHPLLISHAAVDFSFRPENHSLVVRASAACDGGTGVEMEAMSAAAVAALTVYDMCKAASKGIVVRDVKLLRKSGGKSGEWRAAG